jgi:hypothetical protein
MAILIPMIGRFTIKKENTGRYFEEEKRRSVDSGKEL